MGLYFQSFLIEALAVLIPTLLLFYYWAQRKYKYFEERGITYVKPFFIFDSISRALLGFQHISEAHKQIYDKLRGAKLGGFFLGFTPFVTIRDPELVHRVLIKDFSHFYDRGVRIDEEVNPLEGHLFLLSGEKWRTLRTKLSPTFTSGKLKWMFMELDSCTDYLLKTIEEETKDTDGEIEAKDLLARFTTDVIGSCVFGLEPVSIKDPTCMFRKMGGEIFDPNYTQILINAFRFTFTDIFFKLKIRTIPKHINDFFIKLVQDMFAQRKSTGKKRNDFVQLLLQLKEKGSIDVDSKEDDEEDEEDREDEIYNRNHHHGGSHHEEKIEMTDGLLTAQAFVFFAAGFETSATSLSFTLYLLSKHAEAQERARGEVRGVKARHGGKITYAALKEMTYLENCINETMRIFPPIPVLFRECTKKITLDDQEIEKGTKIVIQLSGLNSDPDLYKDPQSFRPERFEEGEGSVPGTFMPFGDGPRICIGKRFAVVEVKLALARILDNYSIERSPKLKDKIKLKPTAFVPQPVEGLWVKFKRLPQEN